MRVDSSVNVSEDSLLSTRSLCSFSSSRRLLNSSSWFSIFWRSMALRRNFSTNNTARTLRTKVWMRTEASRTRVNLCSSLRVFAHAARRVALTRRLLCFVAFRARLDRATACSVIEAATRLTNARLLTKPRRRLCTRIAVCLRTENRLNWRYLRAHVFTEVALLACAVDNSRSRNSKTPGPKYTRVLPTACLLSPSNERATLSTSDSDVNRPYLARNAA
mmetsp:Transcript_13624/g.40306  ORF Transcript_13624/g.40306 Transcript_13624/m.40306 type:complete len:219 (-) Transcript_13624:389-1045(-)